MAITTTPYSRTTWVNDSTPDIDADHLNKIETALVADRNSISGLVNSDTQLAGNFAMVETSPATANHAVGDYIVYNGQLYKVTTAITAGTTLTGKISAKSVADALNTVKIKSKEYTGTTNTGGLITGSLSDFGITDGTQIIDVYFQRGTYGVFRQCQIFNYGNAGFGITFEQGSSYSQMSSVSSSSVTVTIYYI